MFRGRKNSSNDHKDIRNFFGTKKKKEEQKKEKNKSEEEKQNEECGKKQKKNGVNKTEDKNLLNLHDLLEFCETGYGEQYELLFRENGMRSTQEVRNAVKEGVLGACLPIDDESARKKVIRGCTKYFELRRIKGVSFVPKIEKSQKPVKQKEEEKEKKPVKKKKKIPIQVPSKGGSGEKFVIEAINDHLLEVDASQVQYLHEVCVQWEQERGTARHFIALLHGMDYLVNPYEAAYDKTVSTVLKLSDAAKPTAAICKKIEDGIKKLFKEKQKYFTTHTRTENIKLGGTALETLVLVAKHLFGIIIGLKPCSNVQELRLEILEQFTFGDLTIDIVPNALQCSKSIFGLTKKEIENFGTLSPALTTLVEKEYITYVEAVVANTLCRILRFSCERTRNYDENGIKRDIEIPHRKGHGVQKANIETGQVCGVLTEHPECRFGALGLFKTKKLSDFNFRKQKLTVGLNSKSKRGYNQIEAPEVKSITVGRLGQVSIRFTNVGTKRFPQVNYYEFEGNRNYNGYQQLKHYTLNTGSFSNVVKFDGLKNGSWHFRIRKIEAVRFRSRSGSNIGPHRTTKGGSKERIGAWSEERRQDVNKSHVEEREKKGKISRKRRASNLESDPPKKKRKTQANKKKIPLNKKKKKRTPKSRKKPTKKAVIISSSEDDSDSFGDEDLDLRFSEMEEDSDSESESEVNISDSSSDEVMTSESEYESGQEDDCWTKRKKKGKKKASTTKKDKKNKKKKKNKSKKAECAVCSYRRPEIVFRPCGHHAVCKTCCDNLKSMSVNICPVCRKEVEDRVLLKGGYKARNDNCLSCGKNKCQLVLLSDGGAMDSWCLNCCKTKFDKKCIEIFSASA